MTMSSRLRMLMLMSSLLALPTRAEWTWRQFDNFFPAWSDELHGLLDGTDGRNACRPFIAEDAAIGRGPYFTTGCLLEGFPEFRKAEMSSSSVILGLMPVVVSQLGPANPQLALLGVRRPILALLLAAAAPSVSPLVGEGYYDTLREQLSRAAVALPAPPPRKPRGLGLVILISFAEYAAALAALANVAIMAYQLSIWTVTSFAMAFSALPAVYIFLAIPLYGSSLLVVHCYFRVVRRVESDGSGSPPDDGHRWRGFDELIPCRFQSPVSLEPAAHSEFGRKAADTAAWGVKTFIVVQCVVGTMALSGLLFVSAADAIILVVRFAASAIISKLVLTVELSGMKGRTVLGNRDITFITG